MFIFGNPFQSSLMFASRAVAYSREAHFRCSALGEYSWPCAQRLDKLENSVRNKHSRFLRTFANYGLRYNNGSLWSHYHITFWSKYTSSFCKLVYFAVRIVFSVIALNQSSLQNSKKFWPCTIKVL